MNWRPGGVLGAVATSRPRESEAVGWTDRQGGGWPWLWGAGDRAAAQGGWLCPLLLSHRHFQLPVPLR